MFTVFTVAVPAPPIGAKSWRGLSSQGFYVCYSGGEAGWGARPADGNPGSDPSLHGALGSFPSLSEPALRIRNKAHKVNAP